MLSLNKSYKNRKVSLPVHCKYKYFDSTVQRAEDRRKKFYFCRLLFAVNVKLNLSNNNIHEKICVRDVLNFTDSELSSQFCARAKPQVILIIMQSRKKLGHNCTIQGARLIWKQEIWLAICELLCSLTNQNACFITFFCIQLPLFCTVLRKNCTVVSQSESSYFFMYIISPRKTIFHHDIL